jgi:hypothetical protein
MKIYVFWKLLIEAVVAQKFTETKCWVPDLGGWWASNLDGFLPAKLLAYHFMHVSFFCNQKGGLLLSFESRTEILECSPLLLQFQWASIFNSIAKKYTLFQWGLLLSGHTVKRCLVCYSSCMCNRSTSEAGKWFKKGSWAHEVEQDGSLATLWCKGKRQVQQSEIEYTSVK